MIGRCRQVFKKPGRCCKKGRLRTRPNKPRTLSYNVLHLWFLSVTFFSTENGLVISTYSTYIDLACKYFFFKARRDKDIVTESTSFHLLLHLSLSLSLALSNHHWNEVAQARESETALRTQPKFSVLSSEIYGPWFGMFNVFPNRQNFKFIAFV